MARKGTTQARLGKLLIIAEKYHNRSEKMLLNVSKLRAAQIDDADELMQEMLEASENYKGQAKLACEKIVRAITSLETGDFYAATRKMLEANVHRFPVD